VSAGTDDPGSYRCAAASADRDEPLVGTASTVRSFVLVEHAGPWGVDALRDARMPPGADALREAVRRGASRARVRALLIRRPRGSAAAPSGGVRVFGVRADAHEPWVESAVLSDWAAVADLDLARLGAGLSLGLPRVEEAVALVCTHGRHDVCCAERGRPVAAALAASHPEQTWETSHIGGDRYAANLLLLPDGLYHGRVTAEVAPRILDALLDGQVSPPWLRGRSGLRMGVQAAELALREHLGERGVRALRVVSWRPAGDERVDPGGIARWRHLPSGRTYEVVVTARRGPASQLTCRAAGSGSPWGWSTVVRPDQSDIPAT